MYQGQQAYICINKLHNKFKIPVHDTGSLFNAVKA